MLPRQQNVLDTLRGAIPVVFNPLLSHSPGGVAHSRSGPKPSTGPSNAIFRCLHLCLPHPQNSQCLSHVSPRQQGVTGSPLFVAWLVLLHRFCSVWPAVQGEMRAQFGS